MFNLTIGDASMILYELNKKLIVARQNAFIFNHLNKLTLKLYSHLRYIFIGYLKFQKPMCHRQFFSVISQS